jgi:two-component system response regulator MprA
VTCILVVDDEPLLRDVVADALRDEGYAVLTASDGREGVAVVESEAPDLVLMDIMMPGMDGHEAYLAMRAHPNGRTVPIVLSSAGVRPGALNPGVSAFLRKPFDLDNLLLLVQRLLSEA